MKIEDIAKQFSEYADLHKFAESQLKLINQLSQKIVELEDECGHLKGLLANNNVPLIVEPGKIQQTLDGYANAESICNYQLKLLSEIALDRELTLEETKKTEIYSKILQSLKETNKKEKNAAKDLTEEELIRLADNK